MTLGPEGPFRLLSPLFLRDRGLYDRGKMIYHRHYQMLCILSHIYSTDLFISILLDLR